MSIVSGPGSNCVDTTASRKATYEVAFGTADLAFPGAKRSARCQVPANIEPACFEDNAQSRYENLKLCTPPLPPSFGSDRFGMMLTTRLTDAPDPAAKMAAGEALYAYNVAQTGVDDRQQIGCVATD